MRHPTAEFVIPRASRGRYDCLGGETKGLFCWITAVVVLQPTQVASRRGQDNSKEETDYAGGYKSRRKVLFLCKEARVVRLEHVN